MPTVRFPWSPTLVETRQDTCPNATWDKSRRHWTMTTPEAEAFIAACHRRLEFARVNTEIVVDDRRWLVGFVQGAPCVIG